MNNRDASPDEIVDFISREIVPWRKILKISKKFYTGNQVPELPLSWDHWWLCKHTTKNIRTDSSFPDSLFQLSNDVNTNTVYALLHIPPEKDRLCGLVVRVSSYKYKSPGFESQYYQIFWEAVGLERGPLNLVSTTEELLWRKSSGSALETRE
jgi:hypothetical protein